MARKLEHLRSGPNIVTDTFKFAEELYKSKLDEGRIKMISFDVTSLFTRVPLTKTIHLILEKMYGLQHNCPTSERRRKDWCASCQQRIELEALLEICTQGSHFVFNGKIYCQKEGMAMECSLGPLFADVYMNHLESELKDTLEANGILYYKRFVADSFVLIKEATDIKKLLEILNNFYTDIQFTVETENNGSLPIFGYINS